MRVSRLIPIYTNFVRVGETADVFHSMTVCGDEIICTFRRCRITDINEWSSPYHSYESKILLQRFDLNRGTFVSDPEIISAEGEDPRCIAIRDRPYILSATPPTGCLNYILLDVNERRCINVELEDRVSFNYGKNWQPFVLDEQLYAVHGFSPFRIVKINIDTGKSIVVLEKDVGLNSLALHDKYTRFRGGSSALVVGDQVIGFGHITLDAGRHELFRWAFTPTRQLFDITYDIGPKVLRQSGLRIVDPTSLIQFQGHYYLGVSCSNRDWFYGQTYASFLLELEAIDEGCLVSTAKDAHDKRTELDSFAPRAYFFRAEELNLQNCSPSRNFEVLHKVGLHDPGLVIESPRVIVPRGRCRLRLQYGSPGVGGTEVGFLVVCSKATQQDLAVISLLGTHDKLTIATLCFEIEEDDAYVVARVYSTGVADLRITDLGLDY